MVSMVTSSGELRAHSKLPYLGLLMISGLDSSTSVWNMILYYFVWTIKSKKVSKLISQGLNRVEETHTKDGKNHSAACESVSPATYVLSSLIRQVGFVLSEDKFDGFISKQMYVGHWGR